MGVILAMFHWSGKLPVCLDLKISDKDFARDSALSFRKTIWRSSFAGGFTSIKFFEYTRNFKFTGVEIFGLICKVKTGYAPRGRENRLQLVVRDFAFSESERASL